MLVMVLYRMAGAPDMAGRESNFTDVVCRQLVWRGGDLGLGERHC